MELDRAATESLVSTVQQLSLARDLPRVQEIVRTAARKLTGADGATFVLREGAFCHYVDEDAIGPLWKGKRFPIETCISGWAMLHRQPAVIEDIYSDSRIPADAYRPTFVKSLAMVPIRTADPIGAIGTYWATRRLPSPAEVRLIQALADSTSIAMENVLLYTDLERRIRERTAQLEAANANLDSFASSVSHDLRAPLRAIDGYSRILLEEHAARLDAEGLRLLGVLISSAARMGTLIDALLKFSRTAQASLNRAEVDMNALAADAVRECVPPAASRKIEVRIAALPPAWGDPALLRQVFVNLVGNAVKYTAPRDSALIEIGSSVDGAGTVYFVRDNGVGFDPSQAHRLFGVFQRLHSDSEFEGTGIGLALVHRILQRHGGRIWAEGTVERGATLRFSLPARPIL